jgi:hypothetical protein
MVIFMLGKLKKKAQAKPIGGYVKNLEEINPYKPENIYDKLSEKIAEISDKTNIAYEIVREVLKNDFDACVREVQQLTEMDLENFEETVNFKEEKYVENVNVYRISAKIIPNEKSIKKSIGFFPETYFVANTKQEAEDKATDYIDNFWDSLEFIERIDFDTELLIQDLII